MGYTTDFSGKFKLDRELDEDLYKYLKKFSSTRRMARMLPEEYGIEGEFYVDGKGYAGQDHEDNIIDHNTPPSTQPSLWCQWIPSKDKNYIEWNGGEKFYCYIEWLEYIIKNFLIKKGYTLNGVVHWQGENEEDIGTIEVYQNKVHVLEGKHMDYVISQSIKYIKD